MLVSQDLCNQVSVHGMGTAYMSGRFAGSSGNLGASGIAIPGAPLPNPAPADTFSVGKAFRERKTELRNRPSPYRSAHAEKPSVAALRFARLPRFAASPSQANVQWRDPARETLLEEGRNAPVKLEDFFLRPMFKENPFAEHLDRLEREWAFRKASRKYEYALEHSFPARVAVSCMGTAMGLGAYYISLLTNPVMGILAGGFTSPLLDTIPKKAMRMWYPPFSILQREKALRDMDDEIEHGRLATELGEVWPRLSFDKPGHPVKRLLRLASGNWRRDDFAARFSTPEEPAVLIASALISRYPAQQEALKTALPRIRGKYATQRYILPVLRKMAEPAPGYRTFRREPSPLLCRVADTMLRYVDGERAQLDASINRDAEWQKYVNHLQKVLPDLIQYLEG